MLFFKLFKWDENVVVSDKNIEIKNNYKFKINEDFITKILREDPMFFSY